MNKTAGHPSGEKIAGDGTWGEGKPAFAETGVPAPSTGKGGPEAPSIQIKGEAGEIPSSPISVPGKGGGDAGAQGAAALGKAEAEARGFEGGSRAGPGDACARSPTKMPDGTQPGAQRKESPERPTVHERVCGKGQVHSSLRGRPAKEMVGGAAPEGTFAEQKPGVAGSPPQGPAGASARGPEKSLGVGTANFATGSCALESPRMTVKMPPRHPALAAAPPRRRPQAVPSYGNRASFPTSARADGHTLAPRGLGVSQVHLSGPLSVPGPRIPRRDAPAEAPDDALASDPAPSGAREAVSPDGAFGGGKARPGSDADVPFTPTAQQAAGGGGGGGGGGLTPAQQHATNAIRIDEIKGEIQRRDLLLPHYEKEAKDAQRKLEPLKEARQEYEAAVLKKEAAERHYKELAFGTGENAINDPADPRQIEAKSAYESATKEMQEKEAKQKGYAEAKAEADKKQEKLNQKKKEKADLEREQQTLKAKNRKLEEGMSPTDEARAAKDKKRLKRDQDRQREIQEHLEEKRLKREERNSKRPDYRATQRAKARRAMTRAKRLADKVTRLRKAAKNPRLTKSARKKMLAKAKQLTQQRKTEAWKALDAARKAGDEAAEKQATDEIIAAEKEEKAIEEQEAALESEGQPAEPPPDPCTLPCNCNIPCDDGICICFRWPAGGGDDGGDGGGDDGGDDGGGRAGGAEPPDIKIPEGSSVPEAENGDGDDKKKDKEKKPSGGGKGGGGGAVGPQGGAPQFPQGAYFQAGNGGGGGGVPPAKNGDADKGRSDGKPTKPAEPTPATPDGSDDGGGRTTTTPCDEEQVREAVQRRRALLLLILQLEIIKRAIATYYLQKDANDTALAYLRGSPPVTAGDRGIDQVGMDQDLKVTKDVLVDAVMYLAPTTFVKIASFALKNLTAHFVGENIKKLFDAAEKLDDAADAFILVAKAGGLAEAKVKADYEKAVSTFFDNLEAALKEKISDPIIWSRERGGAAENARKKALAFLDIVVSRLLETAKQYDKTLPPECQKSRYWHSSEPPGLVPIPFAEIRRVLRGEITPQALAEKHVDHWGSR